MRDSIVCFCSILPNENSFKRSYSKTIASRSAIHSKRCFVTEWIHVFEQIASGKDSTTPSLRQVTLPPPVGGFIFILEVLFYFLYLNNPNVIFKTLNSTLLHSVLTRRDAATCNKSYLFHVNLSFCPKQPWQQQVTTDSILGMVSIFCDVAVRTTYKLWQR